MSDQLVALEENADDNITGWFRLSALSQSVLFYATNYLQVRRNWINYNNPLDEITDAEWDEIEAAVDGLLYEAKNPMIGLIVPYMTADPLPNVLPCDGTVYNRIDYPNLYDVIDSAFIVDADRFRVPDLRGRTIIGSGEGSGLSDRSITDTGGEETHQLTEGELASHAHTIPFTIDVPVVAPGEVVTDAPVPFTSTYSGSTGGDQAHENMQPFYVLNYGVIAS